MGLSPIAAPEAVSPSPSDFIAYLVERGAVSSDQAGDLRAQAASAQMPIGQLLVREGDLSVKQVMRVLAFQAESPELRFGEIAVKLGFLGEEALNAALRRQALTRKHQIQVVAAAGTVLPEDGVLETVVGYVSMLEARARAAQ